MREVRLSGVFIFILAVGAVAQEAPALRGVGAVKVLSTEIPKPKEVKVQGSAVAAEDALREALKASEIEITNDARVRAHLVLDKISVVGSPRRRLLGIASGRSSVQGRLVLQDADGKELLNKKLNAENSILSDPGFTSEAENLMSELRRKIQEEIARQK